MKHESVINRIISAIKDAKMAVRENLFYDTVKGAVDFADDDIPNWRAVLSVIPGAVVMPIVTTITGGVTANPITVAHTSMTYPTVILYSPSGAEYTGATWVDDGTSIILSGDDDGGGHFVDDITMVIKP